MFHCTSVQIYSFFHFNTNFSSPILKPSGLLYFSQPIIISLVHFSQSQAIPIPQFAYISRRRQRPIHNGFIFFQYSHEDHTVIIWLQRRRAISPLSMTIRKQSRPCSTLPPKILRASSIGSKDICASKRPQNMPHDTLRYNRRYSDPRKRLHVEITHPYFTRDIRSSDVSALERTVLYPIQ